jgi:hypothetical protein
MHSTSIAGVGVRNDAAGCGADASVKGDGNVPNALRHLRRRRPAMCGIGNGVFTRAGYRPLMTVPQLVHFCAGDSGHWGIRSVSAFRGASLVHAPRLEVVLHNEPPPGPWTLRGFTSNERYVTGAERVALTAVQEGLDRPQATLGALIPIQKSPAWWALPQDERRAILEERSAHISIGIEFLPAIARRLHHSRDLGEPFDFLTWFEFAPRDEGAFDELLARLRATEEWRYVTREVDIRLERTA